MAKVYQWSGTTSTGADTSGEVSADTKEEVINKLRVKNIIVKNVQEKKKSDFLSLSIGGGSIKDKDVVVFTRQFSTMIDAGLPLVQALDILSEQVENRAFGKAIGEIKNDVEGGATLADSIKKQPKAFSDLYANMVAAGEAGGILDTILLRLADFMEKAMKLKKKIKGAMIYPIVVTVVAVLVIAIILIFVIPTFSQMFTQLGGTLPLPTQVVIALSRFISGFGGLIILGSIIGLIIIFRFVRKSEKGRYITDSILLKLPIFGVLLQKVAVAKFTRTLGTLISSGIPILEGLEITAKTAGNKVVEKAVFEVGEAVTEGKTLSEPLMKKKVFPPLVTHMIAVGESTGALDTMLNKIADFYDDEVDNATANLTAMMEPLMIVFLGGAVGFIVVAMYLPIFKIITLIS